VGALALADEALYAAKQAGRNTVRLRAAVAPDLTQGQVQDQAQGQGQL